MLFYFRPCYPLFCFAPSCVESVGSVTKRAGLNDVSGQLTPITGHAAPGSTLSEQHLKIRQADPRPASRASSSLNYGSFGHGSLSLQLSGTTDTAGTAPTASAGPISRGTKHMHQIRLVCAVGELHIIARRWCGRA